MRVPLRDQHEVLCRPLDGALAFVPYLSVLRVHVLFKAIPPFEPSCHALSHLLMGELALEVPFLSGWRSDEGVK